MLRAVFMGTPAFALPSLKVAREMTDLRLVVTQPDRRAGRGRKLRLPPVKERAHELGIDVAQPEASVTRELGARLEALEPDVVIVSAFGKILGRKILALPRLGCLNVHASLLPRHRGASPVAWAIKMGDRVTGVTIQQMVAGMDAGDILVQRETPIDPDETTAELMARLADIGAEALAESLERAQAGTLSPEPQNDELITIAPPLDKRDGEIDWCQSAQAVHDHVRAMNPWPIATTTCRDTRLRIHRTRVVSDEEAAGEPGAVLCADRKGIHVICGTGVIEVIRAQREGRKPLCAKEMVCGRLVQACDFLGH